MPLPAAAAASGASSAHERPRATSPPRRPAFHIGPAGGGVNDPNAPLFYKGRYHL